MVVSNTRISRVEDQSREEINFVLYKAPERHILDVRGGKQRYKNVPDTMHSETSNEEEGRKWFENWLKKEPHNENAWSVFSQCVQKQEGTEATYRLIRKEVVGIPCTIHNSPLFERAKFFAESLKLTGDLKWIETQLKFFYDSMEEVDYYNDVYDDFRMPVQNQL